jgi:hypothetical protein
MAHPSEGVPAAIRSGGGPGRKPRRADVVFRTYFQQAPTELQRRKLAEYLGIATDEVPDYYESAWDLIVWGLGEMALRGNQWAMGEILDRLAPKPRRMEVSGPEGGPVRGHISAAPPSTEEQAASQAYYRALQAACTPEGEDPGA